MVTEFVRQLEVDEKWKKSTIDVEDPRLAQATHHTWRRAHGCPWPAAPLPAVRLPMARLQPRLPPLARMRDCGRLQVAACGVGPDRSPMPAVALVGPVSYLDLVRGGRGPLQGALEAAGAAALPSAALPSAIPSLRLRGACGERGP